MKNKNVTNMAHICLELWNVGMFALVWLLFYNKYAFDTHFVLGAAVTIFVYCFAYNCLCHVYKAFRIASSAIGETVFSHLISFGIVDLVLYVQCCLIFNRYINILPGLAAVAAQLIGTLAIVTGFKRYFIYRVPPQKTVFIYGEKIAAAEIFSFRERILCKYSHLFDVANILCENQEKTDFEKKIAACDTVVFYEISASNRVAYSRFCLELGKTVYFTPMLEDIMMQGCSSKHLLDTPLMKYDYVYQRKSDKYLKRGMDVILSSLGLLIALPFMLATAAAIRLEDGGAVLFKQKRCTKDSQVFEILKFRSMVEDAEKNGALPCQANDERITKVGKFIRRTRLDELPQLINILRGDMSLVGPRPERVEHVEQYIKELPEFAYRMRVKGGLTGYAQIFGKYNTSAYDKLRLDMIYIENHSLLLDLKLLLLTVKSIFKPESTEGFSKEKSGKMNKEATDRNIIPVEQHIITHAKLENL